LNCDGAAAMKLDVNKYKVMKLPNLLLVHWILNPGLAFNELILGQRLPKITLIDKQSTDILANRNYIQCPHCQALHSSKRWGKGNAFFHYDGLYCPQCEEKIPTLLNLFTIILLVILFPIWKPLQLVFGERFKAWELSRLAKTEHFEHMPSKGVSGIKLGVYFGGAMSVFYIAQVGFMHEFNTHAVYAGLIGGTIGGLIFGVVMKIYLSQRGRKPTP
jgi:DNA-directed RNA polymerase subunit RPC12/RpoP